VVCSPSMPADLLGLRDGRCRSIRCLRSIWRSCGAGLSPSPARLILFQRCRATGATPGASHRCPGGRSGPTVATGTRTVQLRASGPVQDTLCACLAVTAVVEVAANSNGAVQVVVQHACGAQGSTKVCGGWMKRVQCRLFRFRTHKIVVNCR
jgi:hypothetical protein